MALQKTITLNNGISLTDAYIKIIGLNIPSSVEIGGEKKRFAHVQTSIQANATGSLIELHTSDFEFDLNGGGALAQAYAHLKTLPMFAGAADV
jgi:hypothetical protein